MDSEKITNQIQSSVFTSLWRSPHDAIYISVWNSVAVSARGPVQECVGATMSDSIRDSVKHSMNKKLKSYGFRKNY